MEQLKKMLIDVILWLITSFVVLRSMSIPNCPPGHFVVLYFAAATSYTRRSHDFFPSPLPVHQLFDQLEQKYPGIREKVLDSSALTVKKSRHHASHSSAIRGAHPAQRQHHLHAARSQGVSAHIYVAAGQIEQWLETAKQTLRPGDSVFIPPGTVHASFNTGDQPATLLVTLGPCVGEAGYEVVEVGAQAPWNSLRSGS